MKHLKHKTSEIPPNNKTGGLSTALRNFSGLLVMGSAVTPVLLSIFLFLQLGASGCMVPCVSTVLYG